jgi:peptidyl-prolyl cis-trans isomerase C
MRKITRGAAALVLGSALAASAAAQAPGMPPAGTPPVGMPPAGMPPVGAPPAGMPPAATPPAGSPLIPGVAPTAKPEPRPTGTAATVNGQAIPEVAVYRALRNFPEKHRDMARKEIMAHLIENALIDQYLAAIKVAVDDKEVEKLLGELKGELKTTGKDYAKELEVMMLTEAEFRTEVAAQMRWEKFVKDQGTDAKLKETFDGSPDVFDGTLVRARHILMTPGADEAKAKEAGQKLRGIKQVVEQEAAKAVAALPPTADALAKEQTKAAKTEELFAAYAKEYSACPSKKEGGDLNFFPRAGAMVEGFAKAAYALKPFEMSDVVVTEFGHHLILVTARKPGAAKKFDDVKEDVRMLYAMRLREAVVAQMKPKAQISITPAPAAAPPAPPAGGTPMPPATPGVPPKM